jgi:transcriptional regulator with XRE-family HTH domain
VDVLADAADPQRMPTLADLVQQHLDRTGDSKRRLAVRTRISGQAIDNWLRGRLTELPSPKNIKAFSSATGYSEQTVLMAAARSAGLHVDASSALEQVLPPGADLLDKDDLDAIRHVISSLVSARRNSLVHMASGSGKTMSVVAAAELAARQDGQYDAYVVLPTGERVVLEMKSLSHMSMGDAVRYLEASKEDDYALAARRGTSEGRRQRAEQDAAAEEPADGTPDES